MLKYILFLFLTSKTFVILYLLLFFGCLFKVIWWITFLDQDYLQSMEILPLDEDDQEKWVKENWE